MARSETDRKVLLAYSHRIGQLETEVEHLKQLQAPKQPTLDDNKEAPEALEVEVTEPGEQREEASLGERRQPSGEAREAEVIEPEEPPGDEAEQDGGEEDTDDQKDTEPRNPWSKLFQSRNSK